MPRKPLADKGMQTSLRLPRELYDRLMDAAGDRGIGEEIRQRLEASFTQAPAASTDPLFGDLLAAIGYAATTAATIHPPLGGQDTWSYAAFAEAVRMLLDAFRPEGEPPKPHELANAAAILVGLALAPLGDRGVAPFARLRVKFRDEEGSKP